MLRASVDAPEQPAQMGLEGRVAVWAPEPSGLPELGEAEPAERAGRFPGRAGPLHLAHLREEVGEWEVGRRGGVVDALGRGALLAQVALGRLVVDDRGELDLRLAL